MFNLRPIRKRGIVYFLILHRQSLTYMMKVGFIKCVIDTNKKYSSLDKRFSWLTLLKAFCKLRNIPSTINLLFNAFSIPVVKLYVVFSVVNFVLNPYCSLVKILYFIKWSSSLVCTTCSKIFRKGNEKWYWSIIKDYQA